jgi:hypothetical protein
MPLLGVQGSLLLSGGKRPGGAGAALLSKYKAQLLRRSQLRLMGTERCAGLGQLERAQEVDPEVALITANLVRRTLRRTLGLHCLHQHIPPTALD